jgi:uncharacterized protein DUF4386
VNALPSKQELLAFQDRWMRPAGVIAIAGALIFAAALALQQVGVGDNDAERLNNFHEHSGQLLLSQGVLNGIAFIAFVFPLYVLFRCAEGRAEQVRRGMVAFAFIGPALFAISGLILAVGLNDVSDEFVKQRPAAEQQARQQAISEAKAPKGEKSPTTTAAPLTPSQAAANKKDDLATDLIDDSGAVKTGALLRFPAIIGLVLGLIYIPLWAMRTGLLTRFWASLGMALGASLVLIPFGILGVVLWFAVIGLMLAGWWPGPRPPAWATGEAIPFPRPGEDIGPPEERGPSGAVEGSGREVSEPPLPEQGAEEEGGPLGETQGQRRKKRKRRG